MNSIIINEQEIGGKAAGSRGFTLVELLVVVAIIGMLIALLLPAIQAAREAANRMACTNNLKQLGLTVHNYHDAYDEFPAGSTNYDSGDYRYSMMIALLPFCEQGSTYNQFIADGKKRPWQHTFPYMPTFICPSDSNGKVTWDGNESPAVSYHGSVGDWADKVSNNSVSNPRGFWSFRNSEKNNPQNRSLGEVTDGTSNTIIFSEAVIGYDARLRVRGGVAANVKFMTDQGKDPADATDGFVSKTCWDNYAGGEFYKNTIRMTRNEVGRRFGDSAGLFSAFSTIYPPNGPSCTFADCGGGPGDQSDHNARMVISATSYHTGGVNGAFADGSVRFVSATIQTLSAGVDYSNATAKYIVTEGASNFGVWGAYGCINDGAAVSGL